jgi:hypothetical protein
MLQITETYIYNHKTGSQEAKQLTVNKSSSKLSKNRIAAKNEALQNNLCASIDGLIDNDKKIAYQSKRRDDQKQARKAKRQR